MPVEIGGITYYRTAEVYRILGISRNTLYRWLQKDALGTTERRDIRGWRLFTGEEIEKLKKSVNHIDVTTRPETNRY